MNNINNYKQFIQHVKLNREIKFNKDEYTVFKTKQKTYSLLKSINFVSFMKTFIESSKGLRF